LTRVNDAGFTLGMFKSSATFVALALLLAGCRTLGPEPEPAAKASSTNAPPVEPLIQPLDHSVGRVVSVNVRLRFAVLDYALYQLPSQGQRLTLERDGVDVGELRVNGPVRDTTIVADIVRGEPKVGDRTRPRREAK
jgi:hypothetical protein